MGILLDDGALSIPPVPFFICFQILQLLLHLGYPSEFKGGLRLCPPLVVASVSVGVCGEYVGDRKPPTPDRLRVMRVGVVFPKMHIFDKAVLRV